MAVKNLARGFEVTGTVQNLTDGRVELKVQAFDSDELQGFLDAINDSDLGSLIKEQEVGIIKPLTGVQGFHIIADSDV
jgi:acylphosphatase